MKNATLVCDMQYGSTGKGLIAGYIAERDNPDVVITAWSMNAGHTYINDNGQKFVHCMLANGVMSKNLEYVLIGPGSQIGIQKLADEISNFEKVMPGHLDNVLILIHESACIIQQHHIDEENATMTGIGSTKKGCGAALIDKIKRPVNKKITAKDFEREIEYITNCRVGVVSHSLYMNIILDAKKILIEGAQGYSIGINSGFYPYTTSRECTPAQILSDTGVPHKLLDKVVGTMRTFPIRVANRFNDKGEMIGWSGPVYPDQDEISFEQLGVEIEKTTVTQLPRRIFNFSYIQMQTAMNHVMPDEIFLNFAQYISDQHELELLVDEINAYADRAGCGGVRYLGFGPKRSDVMNFYSREISK